MADPRAPRRGGRGARARLVGAPRSATRPQGCCAAGSPRRRWARPCAAPAPASCTPTTSTRRSAGARSPPRARPARASCCTSTTTGSCARSGPASPTGRTARAATGATRCPGVRLNCRGGSPAESAAYAASLALWQGRIADQADRFLVPSAFALRRLRELGAPVDDRASVLWSVQREFADALARGRRAPRPLRGPAEPREGRRRRGRGLPRGRAAARRGGRRARRRPSCASWRGARRALHRQSRRGGARARCAARPRWRSSPRATRRSCRSPRSRRWPPALPVVAARAGGLAELVPEEGLYPPGDVAALASAAAPRCGATRAAGERALPSSASAARPRRWRAALARGLRH